MVARAWALKGAPAHPVGYMFLASPEWYKGRGAEQFFALDSPASNGRAYLSSGTFPLRGYCNFFCCSWARLRPATPEEEAAWRLGG